MKWRGLSAAQIQALGTKGVDVFNVDGNNGGLLSLTAAQTLAFATTGIALGTGDHVTVVDTGANLTALTAAQIGALNAKGVLSLDGGANSWSLSADEFNALGAMGLGAGGAVSVVDQGPALAALNFQTLQTKGVDVLNSTSNVLGLTIAQATSLAGTNVGLTASDMVSVIGSSAQFSALSVAQIRALAAKGVDVFDSGGQAVTMTAEQLAALGPIKLGAPSKLLVSGTPGPDPLTGTDASDVLNGFERQRCRERRSW